MARRDLTEERTDQILKAFERCIPRHGLEGTSMENVAEEAGMKRSILRHYIGNRDDLIDALADKVVANYKEQTKYLVEHLPKNNPAEALINTLFTPVHASEHDQILVAEALISASARYPKVKTLMQSWLKELLNSVADILILECEGISRKSAEEVANGIIGIYFNVDAMSPLQLDSEFRVNGLASAHRLLISLKKD